MARSCPLSLAHVPPHNLFSACRHNGNIMIDAAGHLIHIDFGFVFGLAPGKQFSMETAPWKLNKDLADVMGGIHSDHYADYRNRCVQAFLLARKHARQIMTLMEIMQFQSNFPCFRYVQGRGRGRGRECGVSVLVNGVDHVALLPRWAPVDV